MHKPNQFLILYQYFMESVLVVPFRPLVDHAVACLVRSGCEDVTADAKRALAGILTIDMNTGRGVSPLQTCLERTAQSLAQSFEDKKPSLIFPTARW